MKFILYTTEESGNFEYTQGQDDEATIEFFEKLKRDGFIALKTGDREPEPRELAYVLLADEEDNYDFMINRKR